MLTEKNDPEWVLTDHIILHYLELPKFKKMNKSSKAMLCQPCYDKKLWV